MVSFCSFKLMCFEYLGSKINFGRVGLFTNKTSCLAPPPDLYGKCVVLKSQLIWGRAHMWSSLMKCPGLVNGCWCTFFVLLSCLCLSSLCIIKLNSHSLQHAISLGSVLWNALVVVEDVIFLAYVGCTSIQLWSQTVKRCLSLFAQTDLSGWRESTVTGISKVLILNKKYVPPKGLLLRGNALILLFLRNKGKNNSWLNNHFCYCCAAYQSLF